MDNVAKMMSESKNSPKGCVHNGDGIEVYVMTWAKVINNAKSRLKFYQEQLNYEANEETSKQYLQIMHNKFIPKQLQV